MSTGYFILKISQSESPTGLDPKHPGFGYHMSMLYNILKRICRKSLYCMHAKIYI